jgi:YD repeat-containing protein
MRIFVLAKSWLWPALAGAVLAVLVVFVAMSATAVAAGSVGPGVNGEAPFWSSLVIEGSPAEAEQRKNEEEARLESPVAIAAREESETAEENLGASEAEALAGRSFPGLVSDADGGPPRLPEGAQILGFPSDFAATVRLADGSRAVTESLTPIATSSGSGRVPIDLAPERDGSGFGAINAGPALGVRIGSRLREGVSLSGLSITLTPVTAGGVPLDAEGRVDGASVFFPDSEDAQAGVFDLDTLVKIDSYGFSEESILRSQRSPEALYFRVGLPEGASLSQEGEGPVQVMDAGASIATILAPAAQDAEGTFVPVLASVEGSDVIKLSVPHPAGRFRYPIVVDPYAVDHQVVTENGHESNWTAWSSPTPPPSGPFHFREFSGYLEDRFEGSHGSTGWWGRLEYVTKGDSHIGSFTAYVYGSVIPFNTESQYHSIMTIGSKTGVNEAELTVPGYFNEERVGVCAKPCETIYGGSEGNHAAYTQYFEREGSDGFWTLMDRPEVVVAQSGTPSIYNLAPGEQSGLEPLSGKQETAQAVDEDWVNPQNASAVLAFESHDPGIGIYRARLKSPQEGRTPYSNPYSNWIEPLAGCRGIQCEEQQPLLFSLTTSCGKSQCSWLPEGEDTVTAEVENATGLWESKPATITQTVKIDEAPPHNITIAGIPSNDQVGEGIYHLSAEATDGESGTPSSGVAQMRLSVDGNEIGNENGSCYPGPCTAHGEWTLNAAQLGAGEHQMQVTAIDNAGNVEKHTVTIKVHAALPVALGPGSVDPVSGQFTLGSTDVSLGGGLEVTRSYSSESPAGIGGALGSAWEVSLAGEHDLTELADGAVDVGAASGATVSFQSNGEGGYVPPAGDSNLSLSADGEGFLLSNAATKSEVQYTQPTGGPYAQPSYFGAISADAEGVAVAPNGNLWVTEGNHVVEFKPNGEQVLEISSESFGAHLKGIAVAKGNVWVVNSGHSCIEEFNEKGEYISQFGQIGTGNGQFKQPDGIAVDAKGDLWVADTNNNRVEEFTTAGEYMLFGAGLFSRPEGITVDSKGNIWVANTGRKSVDELNEKGELIREITSKVAGHELASPAGVAVDAHGHVWVDDSKEDDVLEFTESGEYLARLGSKGSGPEELEQPKLMALGTEGSIVVADTGNERVQRWGHPTWLPTVQEGVTPTDTVTYAYETAEVTLGKSVTRPAEALAPKPAGVSCGSAEKPELKAGCRALTFNYTKETTAKGEAVNEWGDYLGQLTRVYYTAWNSSAKEMKKVEVAHYLYDSQGRLRAEWDPRTEPKPEMCLKEPVATGCLATVYGYDSEGHVTSVTPPAQQGWAFIYGATSVDNDRGRILKVTRAQPEKGATEEKIKSKLREQLEAAKNTEAPAISGTVTAGGRLAVSKGKWTASPITYAYRWNDCNSSGGECSPIAGATNANYTVAASDIGRTLIAEVTAINGAGAVQASTSAVAVKVPTMIYSSQFGSKGTGNGQFSAPKGVALDSKGDIWVTDTENNRVQEFNSKGEYLLKFGSKGTGNGQFEHPEGIAIDSSGNLWITDPGNSRVQEFNSKGEYVSQFKNNILQHSLGIAVAKGNIFVANSSNGHLYEFNTKGELLHENTRAGLQAEGVVAGSSGNIYASSNNNELEIFNEKLEYLRSIGNTHGEPDQMMHPVGITIDSFGDLWVADKGKNRIDEYDQSGEFLGEFGGEGTGNGQFKAPEGIAVNASGEMWVADTANNRIQKLVPETFIEGAQQSPQPGVTVEYNVPVSGEGAPYQLGSKEVEAWGQKDDPAEAAAAAVFPENKPQGWPAKNYEGATVYYFDAEDHTVNVAQPSGGIATSEYNENNDVTRSLSADNRATAVKEGSKSIEVAERLSTVSEYNGEGTELLSTLGPEHLVKLGNGKEVQARSHTIYSYDEGAPEKGGPYRLVTKVTQGAKTATEGEQDLRTTLTGYSGQEGLGWKLRKPTSRTVDPAGLDLISSTKYNEETGAVEEARSPGGNAETVSPPVFSSTFGEAGSGNGQFKEASAVAVSPVGSIWVDDRGDGRIEKFSGAGGFLGAYESKLGKFSGSWGIAVSPKSEDVFVADTGHNCIVEFNENGEELRLFGQSGEGALSGPTGISVTATGEVWVADYGANKVEEFNEEGKYLASVGEGHLKEPGDVSLDQGTLYVTSSHSVMTFNAKGEYLSSFGSKGTSSGQFEAPSEIVVNPGTGDLFVVDGGNERVEEFNPAGKFLTEFGTFGTKSGQFKGISGLAITTSGAIYTSETVGDRVQKFLPPEAGGAHTVYSTQWGKQGSGAGEFLYPAEPAVDANGNVWVTDNEADTIQKFTDQGKYITAYGSKGTENGQFQGATGLTVNQSTGNLYVADCGNNRIQELKPKGEFIRAFGQEQLSCPGAVALDSSGNVWVADMDKNRIVEYSSTGTYIAAYGTSGSGNAQFNHPTDLKVLGSDVYVSDTGNDRVEILNTKGEYVGQIGTEGDGGGQFNKPEGLAFNSASDLFVLDSGNNRIEEFNPEGRFLQSIATHGVGEGQLNAPQGIAVTAAGDIYVADAGNHRIEKWAPDTQAVHDTKTTYYTAAANSTHKECGEHPEWANLPCRIEPAAQPADTSEGMFELPVTWVERYNMYGQPETTVETSGTATRTTSVSYDEADRVLSSHVTSSVGTEQPAVHEKYSESTGALIETYTEGTEGRKATSDVYNTLGQLQSYTDAAGTTSTYSYDSYDRLAEANDGKGTQRYSYNETTGQISELTDSQAGNFKATYDVEGNMVSETYPNGMTASYGINPAGEETLLSYVKTTHCSEHCTWFSDTATPTIHGQWAAQASTLASESYSYDAAGRLAEVQETPAEAGCTTRVYAYDEEPTAGA